MLVNCKINNYAPQISYHPKRKYMVKFKKSLTQKPYCTRREGKTKEAAPAIGTAPMCEINDF